MKIAHIHMMWIWKQRGENLELVLKAGGQRKVNTQTASPGWGETLQKIVTPYPKQKHKANSRITNPAKISCEHHVWNFPRFCSTFSDCYVTFNSDFSHPCAAEQQHNVTLHRIGKFFNQA